MRAVLQKNKLLQMYLFTKLQGINTSATASASAELEEQKDEMRKMSWTFLDALPCSCMEEQLALSSIQCTRSL